MAQRAMAASDAPRGPSAANEPPPIPHVDWYYAVGSERRGPISLSALQQLASDRTVGAATLVWRSGMKDWAPAATIDEIAGALKPTSS